MSTRSSSRKDNPWGQKPDRTAQQARERKKNAEGIAYWKGRQEDGENGLLSYWKVEDARTDELVQAVRRVIHPRNSFSAWEFGCNAGRNMRALQKVYKKMTIYGNDINVPAVKFARRRGLNVQHRDTIDLIKKMGPVHVTISMAHFMHLSKLYNDVLKFHIPRVTKSWLFCVEPTSDLAGWRVWRRNYPIFFKQGFELIQDYPSCIPGADYRIYVFKRKRPTWR